MQYLFRPTLTFYITDGTYDSTILTQYSRLVIIGPDDDIDSVAKLVMDLIEEFDPFGFVIRLDVGHQKPSFLMFNGTYCPELVEIMTSFVADHLVESFHERGLLYDGTVYISSQYDEELGKTFHVTKNYMGAPR